MPDSEFKTVSSTEVPELMNISKWGSRKLLWLGFRNRRRHELKQTGRMSLGKLFQPLILARTADDLALDVIPNDADEYVRCTDPNIPLGCTRDGLVICPSRGRGVVECKAIDQFRWSSEWSETAAPIYYEVQLQVQMIVEGAAWGVIACYIYNEGDDGRLVLYERRINEKLRDQIIALAREFLSDVENGVEPPAIGIPEETEALNELYPEPDPTKIIEVDDIKIAEESRMFEWAGRQESSAKKTRDQIKAKLLDVAKDAGIVKLPGVVVEIAKGAGAGQTVMLPANLRKRLKDVYSLLESAPVVGCDDARAAIKDAMEWAQVIRKPSVRTTIKVRETEPSPSFDQSTIIQAG